MKRIILLASLVFACFQIGAYAQDTAKLSKAETELIVLDKQIQDALVSGDVKIIGRYVADDLVFTHGFLSGGTETKQNFLDSARKTTRFYLYRNVSSQAVEMHGNVAFVLGRLDIRRQPIAKNNETEQMCYALNYLHVYERRKGVWQLLSHRSTQMIEPSKACFK
jgi:ketosteroid isomerase-like protein